MRRFVSIMLTFTALMCFAACDQQGSMPTEATEPSKPVEHDITGKTIIWNGDSICAGRKDTGAWADRIAENNNMPYKNYGVGGGVIVEGLNYNSGEPRHSVSETLELMYQEYPDANFIILEGGTNDADLLGNAIVPGEENKLGTVDPNDFGGAYDESTFCGALESVFYRAKTLWEGKKIGYIVAQKMGDKNKGGAFYNRRAYFDKAIEICEKWDIPYLDLWNTCELDPSDPAMYDSTKTFEQNLQANTGYYLDGQHLTAKGYDLTAALIEAWLKTL